MFPLLRSTRIHPRAATRKGCGRAPVPGCGAGRRRDAPRRSIARYATRDNAPARQTKGLAVDRPAPFARPCRGRMAPVPWRSAGLAFLAKRETGEHLHPSVHNAQPSGVARKGSRPRSRRCACLISITVPTRNARETADLRGQPGPVDGIDFPIRENVSGSGNAVATPCDGLGYPCPAAVDAGAGVVPAVAGGIGFGGGMGCVFWPGGGRAPGALAGPAGACGPGAG